MQNLLQYRGAWIIFISKIYLIFSSNFLKEIENVLPLLKTVSMSQDFLVNSVWFILAIQSVFVFLFLAGALLVVTV